MSDLIEAAEAIERAALADLHAGAPLDVRTALGLETRTLGGALVSIAANDPSIVINRTIGLTDEHAIPEIDRAYRDAGVGRHFVHVYDDQRTPALEAAFKDVGWTPARGWMKFHRDATPGVQAETDLDVRKIGAEHGFAMGRIVAAGFDLSPLAAPLLGALAERDDWHVFMAFEDETPAATGSLFVQGDVGWLDWGASDPAFRRRGAQSALLAARIRRAHELGCRILFTATGEAVPGDPQHSYHNIQRAGFAELVLRGNVQPSPQTAS